MNITGVAAKRRGLEVRLVGVEGDAGHVSFAREALRENGFEDAEYEIHHGIASSEPGVALFPSQDNSGIDWGMEAIYDACDVTAEKLVEEGRYIKLVKIPLHELMPEGSEQIDLLHVDIRNRLAPSGNSYVADF